jgi:simple sugar transport system permease protein
MELVTTVVGQSVHLMIPVLLISLGGFFALKVNVFNLALDGFALFGCFAAVAGAFYTQSVFGGVLVAAAATMGLAAFYAAFVLELKVDAIVCSIAFIIICGGLTRYLLVPLFDANGRYVLSPDLALQTFSVPGLSSIPIIGGIFAGQTALTYVALIAVVIVHIVLYRTKFGFQMRIVGYNEPAAIAAGINVKRIRYICLLANGLFCGLAGAELALSLNLFTVDMTDGRGFTALAVLIMANLRPVPILLVSLLFGFSDAMVLRLSGDGVNPQLLGTLPYLLALVVAVLPFLIRNARARARQNNAERRYLSPPALSLSGAVTHRK